MKRFAVFPLCAILLFLSACSSSSGPVVISDPAAPAPSGSQSAAPPDNRPASSGKPAGAHAARLLSTMTDEQKVGQLFLTSIPGDTLDEQTIAFLNETNIGNIILFSNNTPSPIQTAELTAALQSCITQNTGVPAIIAVDQEGGEISRIIGSAYEYAPDENGIKYGEIPLGAGIETFLYPCAMAIAASGGAPTAQEPVPEFNAVRTAGLYIGQELRAVGINCNLAPVADINSNPANPVIGTRSYGDDAERVAADAAAFATGLQESGVLAVAKHYPGHGDTSIDSHYGLPSVNKTLEELRSLELIPFNAVQNADIGAVMAAHIVFPQIDSTGLPATLSQPVLTGVLRKDGFDGLILTDSMRMGAIMQNFGFGEACVMAINAGADLITTGTGGDNIQGLALQRAAYDAVLAAVKSGSISPETLDDRVGRILLYKERFGIIDGQAALQSGYYPSLHAAFAREVSEKSMTLIRDTRSLIPLEPAEGDRVLAISAARTFPAGADQRDGAFAAQAARRFGGADILVDASPTSEQIAACAAQASKSRYVIVACRDAVFDPSQQALVNAVCTVNPNTIVVCMGLPYDANLFPQAGAVLCAWESTPLSIASAVRVLAGDADAQGVSPVSLGQGLFE